MKVELKALIQKLNPVCRRAIELAAEHCVRRTNYNVEVEHFLWSSLDLSETDLHVIFRHYDVDTEQVIDELTQAIDGFKRGNSRTPAFSPEVPLLLEEAWSVSSLSLETESVRSGAILLAMLTEPSLRTRLVESAPTILTISKEHLTENLSELIRHSPEATGSVPQPESSSSNEEGAQLSDPDLPVANAKVRRGGALDQFTIDLTAAAENGLVDEIRGRDLEIRQLVDILLRRRQNNPILTGEAGVGKTAVVEGFAQRVAAGEVPPPLQNASVRTLDLGLLQAGAGIKGEFERRLKDVIEEVKSSPVPIILFIDEAHTIIGAGGAEGQGDAANLLKPALARGEIRTIAATTWSEYKKYVERDPALARRFQVVKVDEPDPDAAMEMVRALVPKLEAHHDVVVLDEAVRDAVDLSHRYISGRRLPDKAVSLVDTACARVAIGHAGEPVGVEAARRRVERLGLEMDIARREAVTGSGESETRDALGRKLIKAERDLAELEQRWHAELELVKEVLAVQKIAREASEKGMEPEDIPKVLGDLHDLEDRLWHLQGEKPLVPLRVDSHVIASVISDWTGVPVGKMVRDEIRTVMRLRKQLEERVVGQPNALDSISRRISTSSANLEDPSKPTGVFLLVGPSGVGKTETAATLSEVLYGGERNMITVNMSEYQEAHTVSSLKGAPPGYVGYGTGGVLTEGVRRRPYSVVLLDEVEKAHPDVMEVFYQVFDKGVMEDGEGQLIDFKNTLILLTSNVGSDLIKTACEGTILDADELVELVRPALLEHFSPALLGRLVVVPYRPLRDEEIREIVALKLSHIQQRFWEQHNAEMTYDESVVSLIASRCTEVDSGARNIDHIITQTMLPDLSIRVLERMAEGQGVEMVHVDVGSDGGFSYRVDSTRLME